MAHSGSSLPYLAPDSLQKMRTTAVLELLPTTRNGYTYWLKEKTADSQKVVRAVPQKLTDAEVLRLWGSEDKIIAMRMGIRTRYLIIDIDFDSPYNDVETIKHIRDLFLSRRVTLHICQSSSSGGIHLISIFDRPIMVERLCKFAAPLLEHNRFHIADGRLEIYPCKSTKNKVIRLPFQKGYRLLDEELLPYWCGSNVLDRADLFLKLPKTYAEEANFKPPIPRKGQVKLLTANQQKLEDGRYYYENGLDSKSSRSMALFAISYYLFVGCGYGYDKKEERAQLMLKWMRQKHNGFSHEWNRNPRAVEKHIWRLASWEPSDHRPTKPRSQYEIYNKKKHRDSGSYSIWSSQSI